MKLFEKAKKKASENKESIFKDGNGKILFEEDLISMVKEEADKRRRERLPLELQWRLNANFLLGNQHCDINVYKKTVENYQPLYDYMSSEVFNRIAPIMEARMSHLKTVSYIPKVSAATSEYEDLQKAEIASSLLSSVFNREDFKRAFDRALGIGELTGTAFILSWWDEKIPGGQSKKERTSKGDVAFTVLTPYEVLPENLYTENIEDEKSVIIEQIKDLSEIKELYGITPTAEKVIGYAIGNVSGAGGLGYEAATSAFVTADRENATVLRTYLEKPTALYPEGRMIITASDSLIYCGTLPYDRYPLSMIKIGTVSGQFFGKSVIENLIPLQRSYNGIKNRINDYINRSACGQLLVEEGSVDTDDLTATGLAPGAPVVYMRGTTPPKLLEEAQLSEMAIEQCDKLSEDMEYVAGVSGLAASNALLKRMVSGSAIQQMQEIDTKRLSLFADNIRLGVLSIAQVWLSIYHKYVKEARAIELTGRGKRGAFSFFKGEDLSMSELIFEKENELKVRESEQRQKLTSALELGLFRDASGNIPSDMRMKITRRILGKGTVPMTEGELQQENAINENADFEGGVKPEVLPFDDHTVHLEEHRKYVLQDCFRKLIKQHPKMAEPMLAHILEHTKAQKAEQEMME